MIDIRVWLELSSRALVSSQTRTYGKEKELKRTYMNGRLRNPLPLAALSLKSSFALALDRHNLRVFEDNARRFSQSGGDL